MGIRMYVTGTRERRFSTFDSSRFAINPELSARSNREYNNLKSVTDCFKRGPALSAAALAPENCLALFPRATHLIKHARFSCSPDPSHLSFFHFTSPLSHSHQSHEHAGPRGCTRTHTHILIYTYVLRSRSVFLSLPLSFSWSRFNTFPSSSFLFRVLW